MKEFNTTAICVPSKHYMVDISETVNEISQYVNEGKYLTINRGRQYGKTTTLTALARYLQNKYLVLSLDFQDIEAGNFVENFLRHCHVLFLTWLISKILFFQFQSSKVL